MFDQLNNIMNQVYTSNNTFSDMGYIETVPQMVTLAANIIIIIALAASLVFFALSFIKMAMEPSEGDPKKLSEGRNAIVYAVIGILIAGLAYTIKTILIAVFDVTEPA